MIDLPRPRAKAIKPVRLLALSFSLLLTFGGSARGEGDDHVHVTYVTASQVYVDGGRLEGVSPGAVIVLGRLGQTITSAKVSQVADHSAVADLDPGGMLPRVSDDAQIEGLTRPTVVPAVRSRVPLPTIPAEQLAATWQQALDSQTPKRVPYHPSPDEQKKKARVRGGRDTLLTMKSYQDAASLGAIEQRLGIRLSSDDLGVEGLAVRIRGAVDMRYDSYSDRYSTGAQVLPRFREVSVRYAPEDGPIHVSLGRFYTGPRHGGMLDGAELDYEKGLLTVSAFGGLQPGPSDLLPRGDQILAGAGLSLRSEPGETFWRASTGYLLESRGGVDRQALALDTELRHGPYSWLQIATIDLPRTDFNGQAVGVKLENFYARAGAHAGKKTEFLVSARHHGSSLYGDEANAYPSGWLEALSASSVTRLDGEVQWERGEHAILRPYVFVQRELEEGSVLSEVAVAGIGYRRFLPGGRGIDVSADYGDGTWQRSGLGLFLIQPLSTALTASGGLYNQWTFSHDSGLHTFSPLGQVRIAGRLPMGLDLWGGILGGLDLGNTSGDPLSSGGWWQGQLGALYAF